ncbi:MAG: hypothetical protein LKJ44_05215 [Bifidobacteriaceae bacterium]|nr:hypothetical protein [Bifidobacteriaceae bacterium]MCI1979097.1 hypothetical protein [Bifidobacteriaceae bacterium]
MHLEITLGAIGLAIGAVSFALCFYTPIAAGLCGLAAGVLAFALGAFGMRRARGTESDTNSTVNGDPTDQMES